jgi:hypothetical protein
MEKSSKRGKIPQSDWPMIMARYEAGETLASIARTYDCSPPAISYVVSRSRGQRPTVPEASSGGVEAQLVKAAASEVPEVSTVASIEMPAVEVAAPPNPRAPADEPAGSPIPSPIPPSQNVTSSPRQEALRAGQGQDEAPRYANGVARDSSERSLRQGEAPIRPAIAPVVPQRPVPQQQSVDQRRTLHLSRGGGPPHGNGGTHPNEPAALERSMPSANRPPPQLDAHNGHGGNGGAQMRPPPAARDYPAPREYPEYREPAPRNEPENVSRRTSNGPSIDSELRARVDGDIAAFLAAFDAALAQDSIESRAALREATDRLLRAGARTRIELERLEARTPLPPRDNGGRHEPAWRHR